jgi:hypothetical protein
LAGREAELVAVFHQVLNRLRGVTSRCSITCVNGPTAPLERIGGPTGMRLGPMR